MRCIFTGIARDGNGNIVPSSTITPFLYGTSTAVSIYTTLTGTTAVNSVTAGDDGSFTFYIDRFDYDRDQCFDIQISKMGWTTWKWTNVDIKDVVLGTYAIAADKTVSTNLGMIPEGVIYAPASGKTLTISGKFTAGDYQIFSGDGAVVIANIDKYPVQWRGAVGDNLTDNYDAITAANRDLVASAALTPVLGYYRPKMWFPPSLGYRVETGVVIGAGIDVIMDSPLLYVGDANASGTALTIGAAADYNWNANLKLNVLRVTQSDWTESDSTGIKLFNCYQSNILIQSANKFTNGVQFIGDTKGFAYNEITLQYIVDNAYGVTLIDGSASGYVNENNFYGGRFGVISGTNTSVSRSAIKITSNNAYYHNNNNFYKPSFELNNPNLTGAATSVPILLEYSARNAFYNCRFEGSGTTYATVSNLSSYNTIDAGYAFGDISNISHTGSYADTVITARSATHTNSPTEVFNSGAMHKTVGYYDATKCHIPRVHIVYSTIQTPTVANTNITPTSTHVEVGAGRGVGVFVDTSVYKRFVIKKDVVSGYGGRVYINAYDSTGTLLTSAGANHPYILGMSGATFTYSSNLGGSYGTGGDAVNNIVFTCHADVQYVRVALTAGTKVLKIRSFSIQSLDGGSPAVWAGYEEIIPGAHIATQSPTLGTMWKVGSHVYDDSPAASAAPGWVCVFQLETTSAEAISASEKTDISITSLTGVVAGDIVGIELDDGTIYWDSVADVTGGDLTLTGAGPASVAASGNSVYFFRFKAMASLGA